MAKWLNIREYVYDALEPVGVPICYQYWTPDYDNQPVPVTYITYQEPLAQTEIAADDKALERGRYVLVDIWSYRTTEEIADQVRERMEGAGFISRGEQDVPEIDTGTFHRKMQWVYYEEVL